jgi:hypothetical protein
MYHSLVRVFTFVTVLFHDISMDSATVIDGPHRVKQLGKREARVLLM